MGITVTFFFFFQKEAKMLSQTGLHIHGQCLVIANTEARESEEASLILLTGKYTIPCTPTPENLVS